MEIVIPVDPPNSESVFLVCQAFRSNFQFKGYLIKEGNKLASKIGLSQSVIRIFVDTMRVHRRPSLPLIP